jgi:hypothetical protein
LPLKPVGYGPSRYDVSEVLGYDSEFARAHEEETVKRGTGGITSVVAASIVVTLVAGVLGSVASSASTTTSTKNTLARALAAAAQQRGCIYSTSFTLDGHSYLLSARSGATSGEQLISYDGARIDVREVNDIVFIEANAAGVKLQYGESDPTWANRWVEVPPSDAKYASFASGVLLGSTLKEVPPTKIKGAATTKSVAGDKVLVITGTPNATIGLNAGTETLYLSAMAPNLPVRLVVTDKPPTEVRKLTINFSHWGTAVAVQAPTDATLISKTDLPN